MTKITLLDNRHERIDKSRIVWAGGKTILAPDASMFINDDNAILLPPSCLNRAIDHAGGMVTLVAKRGEEVACEVWILSLLNDLNPGTKDP